MKPLTPRQAAAKAAKSAKRYLGSPCIYGHSGERYLNGACCECVRLSNAAKGAALKQIQAQAEQESVAA